MAGFSDYERYDGLGLGELVRGGEVTPTELVEEAIGRIEALNPKLNAVIHTQFERARAAAAEPPGDGPFAGVPFLLKDIMGQEAGEPCSYSTKLLVDARPDRDAELVTRFKRSGLIVLGRTNVPELGIYGVTEPKLRGPARNPWSTDHTPGGSSGGAAAAVAARIVPLAHAGDGGGSIRIPAAHCGLVGLKPTRARNPAGPYAGERWAGFVCEHVVTRTVRDSAAALDATHGPDPGAPYQVRDPQRPFLEEVGADPGRLRIAVTTRALFGKDTHPECAAAAMNAAGMAEALGHEVEEACPEFDREALVRAYFTVIASATHLAVTNAAARFGRAPRPDDVEEATWVLKLLGDKLTAGEYVKALETIQLAGRAMAGFFERFDVLLTPTAARPPVPVGSFEPTRKERVMLGLLRRLPARGLLLKALDALAEDALSATPNGMLFNMTGQPAISLPLHWSADGLPVGTQWVGRFGDEATLFRIASQLEAAYPWRDRRPPILEA